MVKIVRKSKKPATKGVAAVSEAEDIKRKNLKKKRKNRIKRRVTVFVFLLVCIGMIVAVLTAPFFNVKTVYCVGQQTMTEAEILQMAQIQTGKNIFMTNIRAVQKRLSENPEIAEVKIRRVFPDKIKIEITEAKPVAYVEYESSFLMINLEGKIIKAIPVAEMPDAPSIAKIEGIGVVSAEPGTQIVAEDDARAGKLLECVNILTQLEMLDKINYINFADLSDIQLDYENRLYMLLGGYENMEYKLKFCKKVISESISEYEKALFDYRGDKLYVGPRETPHDEETKTEPDENVSETVTETTEQSAENPDKPATDTEKQANGNTENQ